MANSFTLFTTILRRLEKRHYRTIFLDPLIQCAFVFGRSTAAIILGRIIIYVIDQFRISRPGINVAEYVSIWPGIDLFFFNGSILIMSFSLLASAAYTTSREMRFNFFSIFPWLVIAINALVYSIFITEVNIDGILSQNIFFKDYSNWVFWGSLIFLYLSFIRDQVKKNATDLVSDLGFDELRQNFRNG